MRLVALPQNFHDGEVHSIDVNSTNSWVATGGKDHNVQIWKLDQFTDMVKNDPPKLEEITPQKMIDIHRSTIKLLKWSPKKEHVLISANESGGLVKTDVQSGRNEIIFPPSSLKNYEASPVIDGSWSADGRLFAWSTSDGSVHMYDEVKETHQFLLGHPENKGEKKPTIQRSVAFDPNNKFLVVMGDDTMVTVYSYDYGKNDNYRFQICTRISRLMNNSVTKASGVNYRRVSWSCEGEFFAVPNAAKQSTSVISLLSASSGWENNISLVGHDMECDLVKFAPHIFESRVPEDETNTEILDYDVYHIIATAGSNNSLVLWNTSRESPLSVMHNISSRPLVDLTWDKTGEYLLMTTLGGQILVVGFSKGELGSIASVEFLNKFKATQKQVKKQTANKSEVETTSSKKAKAIETVSQNDATDLHDEGYNSDLNDTFVSADESKTSSPVQPGKSQLGVIIPQVLTPGIDLDSIPENDLISAMDERVGVSDDVKIIPTRKGPKQAEKRPSKETNSPAPTLSASPNITIKNGKKRIQPIPISNGGANQPKATMTIAPQHKSLAQSSQATMEFDRPSYSVSDEMTKDVKRQKLSDEALAKKKSKRELEPVKFIGSILNNPTTSFAQVRLSVPKVRSSFRIPDAIQTLDVKNGQGNESAPSRITCLRDESQTWTDFIPQLVQLATKGSSFWALSTADGTIHTYSSSSGKRVLPPIVLGSPISFLESKNQYLMAVTSIAEVYVWNVDQKKSHMKSTSSLAALLDLNSKLQENTLSRSDNITMCSITSSGIPIATLSNGSGFIYNIDMEVWQAVTEAWWAFGSHYWDSMSDDKTATSSDASQLSEEREGSSIIGLLEHKTNEELTRKSRIGRGKLLNKISKNMMMKEGFENLENTVSLSHLENRILCCEILGEQADFKDFLITYTNRLCELGLQTKLFEVCQGISEAPEPSDGESVQSSLCGLDRKGLLKSIILACAEHRDSQRVLTHFSKKIGLLKRDYE